MSSCDRASGVTISSPRRSGASSLVVSWFWTLAGNGGSALTQWLLIVCLARMSSAVVVGYYAWSIAVAAPLVLLSNLSLRIVLTGDTHTLRPFRLYLHLRLITTAIAGAVIVAVAVMMWADTAGATMLLAVGAAKCVEAISDIYYGLYQRNLRADLLARSAAVKSIIGFVFFTSLLAVTLSPVMAFGGLILVHIAAIAFIDVPYGGSWGGDWGRAHRDVHAMWSLAAGAAPLGVVWMLNSVTGNAPRYLLEHYVGPGELGIFAAVTNVGFITSLICLALGETCIPRFASLYRRGEVRRFVKLLACVGSLPVVVGLAFGLVTHLAGADILTFVYGHEYALYSNLLTVSVLAFVTCNIGTFVSCALYATGEYHEFVWGYLINTAVVLLACWLCVKHAHLLGGVLSLSGVGLGSIVVAAAMLSPRLRARRAAAQHAQECQASG